MLYEEDGRQKLDFNRTRGYIARQLPVREMGADDELYVYFTVPKGDRRIVAFQIGSATSQELDLELPAK